MTYAVNRLADLSSVITKGTTPTTLGFDFADSGVPFLRAQNLREGRVDVDADPMYIPHETHRALARSRVVAGDILLSIAGTIGRAALVDERWPEMNCNQAVAIIRPTGGVVPRYLLHWLGSENAISQIRRSEVTATISNLSLSQIGNLRIAVPPLDEQRRIAAILDQADELRRMRREACRRIDELAYAIYRNKLGDPVANPLNHPSATIGALGVQMQYGPRFYNEVYSEHGTRIVRITDLSETGELNFDAMPKLSVSGDDLNGISPGLANCCLHELGRL